MDKELFVHRLTAFNNHGLTPVFDFIKTRYNKDVNNFKVNLIEDIEDFNKDYARMIWMNLMATTDDLTEKLLEIDKSFNHEKIKFIETAIRYKD